MKKNINISMLNIGLPVLCGLLTLGWLIPNRGLPWQTFHLDAWIGIVLNLTFVFIIFIYAKKITLTPLMMVIFVLAFLPFLQYVFGEIYFFCTALLGFIYIFGLLMAVILGVIWVNSNAKEGMLFLMAAIFMAAIISVGIEIYQWLRCDFLSFWIINPGVDGRFYANIGQPNQLASLIVLGELSLIYLFFEKKISKTMMYFVGVFFIFGIALTQSRIAIINLLILIIYFYKFKNKFIIQNIVYFCIAMLILLPVVVFGVGYCGEVLFLDWDSNYVQRSSGEIRPAAWIMISDAILQHPWVGYGFNQNLLAEISVIEKHPKIFGYTFSHSHNLFLDIFLWFGIPVGVFFVGFMIFWIISALKNINSYEKLIAMAAILILSSHAMVELPLHYAYLLFPFGIFMGIVDSFFIIRYKLNITKHVIIFVWATFSLVVAGLVVAYFRLEEDFYDLRFQKANIQNLNLKINKSNILLDQLYEIIRVARLNPGDVVGFSQIEDIRKITEIYPSFYNMYLLAEIYAENNMKNQAKFWLEHICLLVDDKQCAAGAVLWENFKDTHGSNEIIPWPWPKYCGEKGMERNFGPCK